MKRILSIIAGLLITTSVVAFQPTKPVTVIIPFTPGGGADGTFKHLQKYANTKGINMVPLYKPGADGLVGMSELSLMQTDGHVISVATAGTIAVAKNNSASYELTKITQLRRSIFAFVSSKKSDIKTITELEKGLNGKLNAGYGAPGQLTVLYQFFTLANTVKPTIVPYKGASPVVNDLLGGHIDFAALPLQVVSSHVAAGKLNLIATTSRHTLDEFPVESIYKRFPSWQETDSFCVIAPPNLNKAALDFWSNFLKDYLSNRDNLKDFTKEYTEIMPFGPEGLDRTVKNSMARLSNM
jgi:tripartite-type tricarboxylate transporter receptor subunit TctC